MAIITAAVLGSAALVSAGFVGTAAAVGIGGVLAGGALYAGAAGAFDGKSDDGGNNAAQAAVDIETKAKEAEALAEVEAKEAARTKLAQQTQTIFTSGLGLLGTKDKSKSTLGSN